MRDFKVGDNVFLRGEVIEVIEPKHRGIGVSVQFGEKFHMPSWCDASVLTSETRVQAEARLAGMEAQLNSVRGYLPEAEYKRRLAALDQAVHPTKETQP